VRRTGHNSKTCPECARIMVIKRPVLEEPAMEGTSNADPVSSKMKNCDLFKLWSNPLRKTPCWNRNL